MSPFPDYEPPELSLPPVYTVGVNPALADFLRKRGHSAFRRKKLNVPFPEIVVAKTSAAYRAHSYHTKVPPEGIAPFIERYSRPGNVVLDPFCGSGMTGVAALQAGRRAVLVDLSPAATFIAANYSAQADPNQLAREADRVLDAVRPELEPLYATRCRACGGPATIAYTVWSDRYACPDCRQSFILWDVARQGRRVAAAIACPACAREARKDKWSRLNPVPVLLSYQCAGGCGRQEAPPSRADARLARAAGEGDWQARFPHPRTPIPKRGDEIARVHKQGISRVDQLFTRRNLRAIATLWHTVATLPGLECRHQLFFCLTGAMPRASRTNKYIPALGAAPGPILGTMYIPGFHPELNVLALVQRKVADAVRYYRVSPSLTRGEVDGWMSGCVDECQNRKADSSSHPFIHSSNHPLVRISTQSATDLSNIPDASIDYAFTDPPFGSNIAYSELNLLWESWLGVRTHVPDEAIVSRTQRKSVDDYQRMMAAAFAEVRRVLRPGGRFSIVFHNTSAEVWRALQNAIDDAGLAVESAVTFDKGPNQSFKQFTAEGAVTHDLVVTCLPCGRGVPAPRGQAATEADVTAFLQGILADPAGTRDPRKLYSLTIAHFLVQGSRVPMGFKQFRRLLAGQEEGLGNGPV
ncbi:MAG TPA: DNA methyltransferase [Planctomycetota bacterium]|nr:DNA methyltransferase [Planctomycetota bacterium]